MLFYVNFPGQLLVDNLIGPLRGITVQTLGTGLAGTPAGLVVARATSLVLSLMAILVTWVWARSVSDENPVGAAALSALLVVCSPLLVRHASYITPDTLTGLCVTGALFAATKIALGGNFRWYIGAALMIGLAASSKYNTALVGVAVMVAHIQVAGWHPRKSWPLVAAGLLSIITIFAASPYLILDSEPAVQGFLYEVNHYRTGHPGMFGSSLSDNASWVWGQTGLVIVLALGCVFHRNFKALVPVFVFVVLYFLMISFYPVRFERNLIPILPAIYLAICLGVVRVGRKDIALGRSTVAHICFACGSGPSDRPKRNGFQGASGYGAI